MLPSESKSREIPNVPIVLLAGASGYVGGRLIPLLEQQPVVLRCLARNPDKLRPVVKQHTQVVRGDVLDPSSLDEALQGVHTAYYLVHLMSKLRGLDLAKCAVSIVTGDKVVYSGSVRHRGWPVPGFRRFGRSSCEWPTV